MTSKIKPRIGITLGDLNGIGTEVVIKSLMDKRMLNLITPVIFGCSKSLTFYKNNLEIPEFNFSIVKEKGQYATNTINVVNCWEDKVNITPGQPSRESGHLALLGLKAVVEATKEELIDGFVTAPIDKSTIHGEDFPFKGHTEYLTQSFEATESLMLMVSDQLKVGLVTEHFSLREVVNRITKDLVELKIRLFEHSLKKDFLICKPKIAVLALNPHAGEDGLLGSEENVIIKPVIEELQNLGKLIYGPFPADGFFGMCLHKKFDGTLAMYHDQGLVAFKYIAFDSGVNFTAGLPTVRTSPDHGTAYDIAGKNCAEEGSMRRAIFLAADIIKNRVEWKND